MLEKKKASMCRTFIKAVDSALYVIINKQDLTADRALIMINESLANLEYAKTFFEEMKAEAL